MLLKIYGLDKYYDTIKQTLLHLYKTRFAVKEKNVKADKETRVHFTFGHPSFSILFIQQCSLYNRTDIHDKSL